MSRAAVISKIALSVVAMTMCVAAQTNEGPRNFTGSNTTQIVNVNQSSSGYALKANTPSTHAVGAIFGAATATSGFTNGVWGRSFSPKGVGVRGEAMATASTGGTGSGVYGHANFNGFGVVGRIDSQDFSGAGVVAISGPSCCGVAAIFEQQASSSGEVLHAQTNFSGVVHRVLTLDNQGNLAISGQYSTTNGDSATITFTGTSIAFLTETNTDEGTIGITLDGASKGTVNANSATRSAQQRLYTAGGLVSGTHTLTVTKVSGTYLIVDGFVIG